MNSISSRILFNLAIGFLLTLFSQTSLAQKNDDLFEAEFEISCYNTVSNSYEYTRAFYYGIVASEGKAREIEQAIKATTSRKAFDDILFKESIGSTSRRKFKATVMPGTAVIAILRDELEVVVIPIKRGKNVYRYTAHNKKYSSWEKGMDGEGFVYQALPEATVTVERESTDSVRVRPSKRKGHFKIFPIDFILRGQWAKNSTRLIIQPYAVDCLTEDTLENLRPIVYEGRNFHELQDKRMDFDYEHVDPLHRGYDDSHVIVKGQKIHVSDTVMFWMPDVKRSYKCPYSVSLEDYHHQYHTFNAEGSCLEINPFKLLDFTPALGEIELNEDFRIPGESKFGKDSKALDLRYDVGKDVFIDDSLNWAQLDEIVKQMNAYGESLQKFDIEGSASPDGSYQANEGLARRRALNAATTIRSKINKNVSNPNITVKVCTWSDVVDELKRRGKAEDADVIKNLIDAKKTDAAIWAEVKNLPQYDESIRPVLESQRRMSCSIMFMRPHVLIEDEAAEQYYKNKKLAEEDKWKFSEGDYYNLFYYVTDSADLDTITVMAYEYCKRDPDYVNMKLAPYVANRMAMIGIKRGNPDPSILDPFLDYSAKAVHFYKAVDELRTNVVNRREHLMNQAIIYFMLEKQDTAQHWLDKLLNPQLVPIATRPSGAEALDKFITFETLYDSREPDEEQKYQEAKRFVLSTGDDNRAVLYTEIPEWRETFQAERLTDLMDDNNPKKWYLKGLQWASESKIATQSLEDLVSGRVPGTSENGEFRKLSEAEEAMLVGQEASKYFAELEKWEEEHKNDPKVAVNPEDTVSVDNIPYYLAYFQHCFDLEPRYQRFYYQDGHLLPSFRRAHKYKFKDVPAYRRLFKMLKAKDDMTRAELLKSMENDLDDVQTQSTNNTEVPEQSSNNNVSNNNNEELKEE